MQYQVHISVPPRKPWWSGLVTALSFVTESVHITASVVGLFKNLPATYLSLIGFVGTRIVDKLKDKEHRTIMNDRNAEAGVTLANRSDRVIVAMAVFPLDLGDRIGLEKDFCDTPAGRCSSTVLILSCSAQAGATYCQYKLATAAKGENTLPYLVGASIGGVIATALPRIEKHYRQENQERQKTQIEMQIAALTDIPVNNAAARGIVLNPW